MIIQDLDQCLLVASDLTYNNEMFSISCTTTKCAIVVILQHECKNFDFVKKFPPPYQLYIPFHLDQQPRPMENEEKQKWQQLDEDLHMDNLYDHSHICSAYQLLLLNDYLDRWLESELKNKHCRLKYYLNIT